MVVVDVPVNTRKELERRSLVVVTGVVTRIVTVVLAEESLNGIHNHS